MAEHAEDFEWRGEGEEAEVVLYAPDGSAFAQVLPAARLPGVESPVYAAAWEQDLGWVASSTSHAAPELFSAPARGLLLVADTAVSNLDVSPTEVPRLISRNVTEVNLPSLSTAGVRRFCEFGALAAAEDGLIEEEDLPFFDPPEETAGEADALGWRAVTRGSSDYHLGEVRTYSVSGILDAEGVETISLGSGALALVLRAGSGDLGRLALSGHADRISNRDFERDPSAAPVETEEAVDLLAAMQAAANFAAGRVAMLLYAARTALEETAGGLSVRASWTVGGLRDRSGLLVHRHELAAAGEGEVLVSGNSVAAGTGGMSGSAPPFGGVVEDGRWPWEEAGLLERWAELEPLRSQGKGG